MSKEKRRVPKLRFPGFTEDWEQRKLGDYLIQYTKITTQNNQYPVLTSSRKGLFFQTDYYDGNQIASKDNTGYNIVPYGYFTYRHMSDDDIFHFNINYIVDKGIVSTLYPVFTTKNLNSNYLQLQLNYGTEFRKYAVLLKQGGSRTYMYFNKLKDLKLTLSTSIDEQEIIAKFFIAFEKLITLHQRKLDNLKLKKKALLQKLFPKNGERYPELRFPGFTDAWEQRKLGDIVDFLDGQRKPLKESDRIKGKYPYYGASGIIDYINDYLFDENLVLLSEDGANIIDRNYPVCFIATGKYWVNNHAHVLKVKTGVIDKFICESLERLDYTKFNTGTAQPKLNQDICQKIAITLPNEDEQKCISEFLDRINNIITLHQRKLDHLKLQKKALLQQMFV